MANKKNLIASSSLTVFAGKHTKDGTFDKEVAALLRRIVETGSLYAAAQKERMAYSKAWRLFKETEKAFGYDLLKRSGARGSTPTKKGLKLLEAYEQLEAEAEAFVSKRFEELIK